MKYKSFFLFFTFLYFLGNHELLLCSYGSSQETKHHDSHKMKGFRPYVYKVENPQDNQQNIIIVGWHRGAFLSQFPKNVQDELKDVDLLILYEKTSVCGTCTSQDVLGNTLDRMLQDMTIRPYINEMKDSPFSWINMEVTTPQQAKSSKNKKTPDKTKDLKNLRKKTDLLNFSKKWFSSSLIPPHWKKNIEDAFSLRLNGLSGNHIDPRLILQISEQILDEEIMERSLFGQVISKAKAKESIILQPEGAYWKNFLLAIGGKTDFFSNQKKFQKNINHIKDILSFLDTLNKQPQNTKILWPQSITSYIFDKTYASYMKGPEFFNKQYLRSKTKKSLLKWGDKIVDIVKDKKNQGRKILILAEAHHFPGPSGVLSVLQKNGFNVHLIQHL